jgi:hypothetical protein
MTKYYRVKVTDSAAYLVDDDNKLLSPDLCRMIGMLLVQTAEAPTYLYIGKRFHSATKDHWKIGISKEPDRRAKELDMSIFHQVKCSGWGKLSANKIESALHKIYTIVGKRVENEWYDLTPYDVLYLRDKLCDSSLSTLTQKNNFILIATVLDVAQKCFDTVPCTPKKFDEIQLFFRNIRYSRVTDATLSKSTDMTNLSLFSEIYKYSSQSIRLLTELTIYLADLYRYRWEKLGETEYADFFKNLHQQSILEEITS